MSPGIRRYPFLENYMMLYFDARHVVVKLLIHFFFKKKYPFGKYRMLPQFSRLGAGRVKNYVDELILFFEIASCILLNFNILVIKPLTQRVEEAIGKNSTLIAE